MATKRRGAKGWCWANREALFLDEAVLPGTASVVEMGKPAYSVVTHKRERASTTGYSAKIYGNNKEQSRTKHQTGNRNPRSNEQRLITWREKNKSRGTGG